MSPGKERGGGEVAKLYCVVGAAASPPSPHQAPSNMGRTPSVSGVKIQYEGCRGVLSLKGSVGQGQELP